MEIGKTFDPNGSRDAWRGWLHEHHTSEPDIWLVMYTKESGQPSLSYNDSIEEALCFGWVDSIVKKLGSDSRAQRYSPRRKGSPWSEMNKARARRLVEQGLMTEAGLAAGIDFLDEPYEVPDDILAALKTDSDAWEHFQSFPESYVRIRVGWIDGSRERNDVFQQRLEYFIKMTRQGKRFGMVQ